MDLIKELIEKTHLLDLKEKDFQVAFSLYFFKSNPMFALETLKSLHLSLEVRKEVCVELREKADEWKIELPELVREYLFKF